MDITSIFKAGCYDKTEEFANFVVEKVYTDIFVGKSAEGQVVVLVRSASSGNEMTCRKTKQIKIECDVDIVYQIDEKLMADKMHIFTCLAESEKEQILFLETMDLLLKDITHYSRYEILEAFQILSSFFANNNEPSENELMGLYAELYAMAEYHETLELEKYWQSKDRMKFDFSVSDKVKIEVKSTTKPSRQHHFKHEQLATDLYDIYIASYMLRTDDEGLSLYDLMLQCKSYLLNSTGRILRLNHYFKNTSEERLKSVKYSKEYTEANKRIFKAKDVPQFDQYRPKGVFNAEYDCDLENATYISVETFVDEIRNIEK